MSRLSQLIRHRKDHLFSIQMRVSRYFANTTTNRLNDGTVYLHYYFNVIPKHKLIYIEVPKAGCTTMKSFLARTVNGIDLENPLDYHERRKSGLLAPSDIGFQQFEALLHEPELLIFTVVRNPFARLRSCYLDKFASLDIGDPKNAWLARQIVGRPRKQERILSFERFVEQACSTAATTRNPHWMPMSRIVPSVHPIMVVKLESLTDGIRPILDRLGCTENILQRPLNTTKPFGSVEWTGPMLQRVKEAYADDFLRFGYDIDSYGSAAVDR